jgi:polyisoprenoid-binding protein YceI
MLKRQNKLSAIFFTILFGMGAGTTQSYARQTITFGPSETKIEGSIKYTVIGKYTAHFNHFKGRVTLDERAGHVESVYLDIDAASIKSNHPLYDRAARSRRLLYAARYPKIIFKSDRIIHDKNGYKVEGVLEMHGIARRMAFPFQVDMFDDQLSKRKLLHLKGTWAIDRKDFNIIWNRYLDHGGIVVSDIFTVSWGITVYIQS